MTMRTILAGLAALLLLALPVAAQTSHYVAPPGYAGAGTGDGTQANPWRSLGDALKAAGPGDTLLLMDGSYGRLSRTSGINSTPEAPVTIRSLNGKNAHFESIFLRDVHNIVLKNLSVWPTGETRPATFVHAEGDNTTIDGLDVRSREDALTAMYSWTAEDWLGLGKSGIRLNGSNSRILKSRTIGVGAALTIMGPDSEMIGNEVIGHSADAMRAFGDRSLVKGNRTRDAFKVSTNHDDGFQSWSINSVPVTGLTLDGNIIVGWQHPDRDHPLRSWNLQGIGLFDGWYDDLTIINNIVAVTMFHGITVMGTRGALIANNTTLTLDYDPTQPKDSPKARTSPIRVFNKKNGSPSLGVVMANNVAMGIGGNIAEDQITWIDNTVYSDPASVFEDVAGFDFRPRADSGAIDTADSAYATARDVFDNARPQGSGPDRGAIERGGSGGEEEAPAEETEQPTETEVSPDPEPVQEETATKDSGTTGDTGSDGTSDGGSTGDGGGDTDGGTGDTRSPGPKFVKPPKEDNPNKGKGLDKQALKSEREARKAARKAAKLAAKAAFARRPSVSSTSARLAKIAAPGSRTSLSSDALRAGDDAQISGSSFWR